jgi:CRP-like cAMP-binding protein
MILVPIRNALRQLGASRRSSVGAAAPAPSALPHAEVLASIRLLQGLAPAQLERLGTVCREQRFEPGQFILREGHPDPVVHVLVEGRAELVKSTSFDGESPLRMGEFQPGDVVGELKIVDPQPSSASVVAIGPVTTVALDLAAFQEHPGLTAARTIVLENVGRILAERLRSATSRGADAMHRELRESRARVQAGRFIVFMVTLMASYQLVLAGLLLVPPDRRPPDSILSFGFILGGFALILQSFRRSPFPLESYGLTFRDAGPIARQALLWTVPLLGVALVVKLALVRWAPSMADRPLFDPAALFAGRPFDLGFYLLAMLLYAVHTPLQETVTRAGFQGTLQHLLPAPPGRVNWRAIVISNLLFAAAHCYIGFWFSVLAFVPGLFWGWLFDRQRSLVGVVVSHLALGLWAIFALGVHAVIGGG